MKFLKNCLIMQKMLKKKINLATGSDLVEEKSYEDYTGKG